MSAMVYLVGCGPGDPRLLTLRAAEVIAGATAIVHPPAIGERVLDLSSAGAHVIQANGAAAISQLMELVAKHETIVRLYLGDPLLQPAAVAEATALRTRGVRFEVVAGIPTAFGSAACAGIPLSGDHGQRPILLLPSDDSTASYAQATATLVSDGATLVVDTAVGGLRRLVDQLVAAGSDLGLPIGIIRNATRPGQTTEIATLRDIEGSDRFEEGSDRIIAVIGESVALRESSSWFERRPLAGKRIVVTRPRAQAERLTRGLEELGAEVLTMPTIRITGPTDPERLRTAAREPDVYDWIIFTSANGVIRFWEALREGGLDTRSLAGVSLCAIGPATAAAVEMEGARPDLMPEEYVAESVIAALKEETDIRGSRILLPRAEVAREVLPDSLRELGAHVDDVPAYRTVLDSSAADRLREEIGSGTIDLVTFTSSSTVRNFAELAGVDLHGAAIASIGPITSATARELGWPIAVEASVHTGDGLLEAIRREYAGLTGE